MQNLNVVLFTDTYWPIQGGVEEAVRTIAGALKAPFEPVIVTHAGPRPYGRSLYAQAAPHSFEPYTDPAGRRVLPLLPGAAGRLWLLGLQLWNLPGLKRKNAQSLFDTLYWFYRRAYLPMVMGNVRKASLVHCFSTGYLARCTAEACGKLGIPFIVTPAIHFGRWGDSPRQLAAYAASDAIVCLTGYFKKQLLELIGSPSHAVEIIPPVIRDQDTAAAPPEGAAIPRPFVLFLGRRERHKGIATLLEALSLSEGKIQLVVAGPSGERPLNHERVIDLGVVPEPVKQWLLCNCALLCVPSADESFGMVYAEAMRCGKPVVALDIPHLHELVEHGVTGLLAPPGNAKALAMAIMLLLSDGDLQTRMGNAARKRFDEQYAGDKSMGKIVALYNRVLLKKKTG